MCGLLRMLFAFCPCSSCDCTRNPRTTPAPTSLATSPSSQPGSHPPCPPISAPCSLRSSTQCSTLVKCRTKGINGDLADLSLMLLQSMSANHGWFFNSSIPLLPNLLSGFLRSNWFTKSAAFGDHLKGSSSSLISACLVRMLSRIYFLFLPL